MTVGAYCEDTFLGYGHIVEVRWNRYEMLWEANILRYSTWMNYSVPSRDIERGKWSRFQLGNGMLVAS